MLAQTDLMGTTRDGNSLARLCEVWGVQGCAGRRDRCAAAIHRVLVDAPLRDALRLHGLNNVKRFSWELSAHRLSQGIDALMEPEPVLLGKQRISPESSSSKP